MSVLSRFDQWLKLSQCQLYKSRLTSTPPPVDYILLAMNWVLFALISNDQVNLKVLKYFRIITIVSKLFIIHRICVI